MLEALNNTREGTTTLTQNNGLAFTLNSIGIATLFAQPATPGAVTFTGNVQGGGTVTQSFTNGANDNLETVIFGSNFTNLTSVSFVRTTAAIQFDNIVLNGPAAPAAVPEPSQTAALGLGLLGLSALMLKARKRKASSIV